MGPKGVAGLWGRGASRWSCIPRMPCFDLWLDAFFLFFRIWVNRIKYKSAHARYRYKITAGFYFIHFQVDWNTDNTLIYSCLFCLGVLSHLTTTMCFFCRHVWTVTLVTMQPISDDMLTTSKICVAVAKCPFSYAQVQIIHSSIFYPFLIE